MDVSVTVRISKGGHPAETIIVELDEEFAQPERATKLAQEAALKAILAVKS